MGSENDWPWVEFRLSTGLDTGRKPGMLLVQCREVAAIATDDDIPGGTVLYMAGGELHQVDCSPEQARLLLGIPAPVRRQAAVPPAPCPDCAQPQPTVKVRAMSPGYVPITMAELVDALRTITGSGSCETCNQAREMIGRYEGDYHWSYAKWFRDRAETAGVTIGELVETFRVTTGLSCSCANCQLARGFIGEYDAYLSQVPLNQRLQARLDAAKAPRQACTTVGGMADAVKNLSVDLEAIRQARELIARVEAL